MLKGHVFYDGGLDRCVPTQISSRSVLRGVWISISALVPSGSAPMSTLKGEGVQMGARSMMYGLTHVT